MQLEKIKSHTQLPVGQKLVSADFVVVDGQPKRLTMTFEGGAVVEVFNHSYNELGIAVKPEPKLVERWQVKGTLVELDIKVDKLFDDESSANTYIEELGNGTNGHGVSNFDSLSMREQRAKLGLMVKHVRVREDAPTEVVNEGPIPF